MLDRLLRRRDRRPSPALVISLVALAVALGGTSYAAITITGNNVRNSSLTGTDVRNSSLTGTDVKNSSLTGSDVKNRSLTTSDLSLASIRTLRSGSGTGGTGGSGSPGKTGPTGATGPAGPAAGFSSLTAAPIGIAKDTDELGSEDRVASITLPPATNVNYIVTASVDLGLQSAQPIDDIVTCQLRDGAQVIGQASADLTRPGLFSDSVAITGSTDGGFNDIICASDTASISARSRNITAVRVNSLN
jgi:hypothetical protein